MTNAYYMNKKGNSFTPYATTAKKGLQYNLVGLPNWVSPVQTLSQEAKNLMWIEFAKIAPEGYMPPPPDAQHSAQMALDTIDGIITDPKQLTNELERITV